MRSELKQKRHNLDYCLILTTNWKMKFLNVFYVADSSIRIYVYATVQCQRRRHRGENDVSNT